MIERDWSSRCDDSGLQVPAGALPPRVMRDGVDPPVGSRVSTVVSRCRWGPLDAGSSDGISKYLS